MSITLVKDIAERVVVTFLQAWLGAWLVVENATLDQLFEPDMLMVGVVAAVASLLKGLGATQVNRPDSASLAPDV